MHRVQTTLLLMAAFGLLSIGCDKPAPSSASAATTSVSEPKTEAQTAPETAPDPEPAPEPAPAPDPDPEPASEPAPSKGPIVAHLPGGSPINGTMKPLDGHPEYWVADISVTEVAEGETPPAAITDESQAVTITMSAWNMHGDHGHLLLSREMVVPYSDTMVFPGWQAALSGQRIGDTRKIWASSETVPSKQMAQGAPVVFDIELKGVDTYITVPPAADLPGEPVGDAELQTSESGLQWYDVVVGDGGSPAADGRVKVHYSGWLVDGKPFDSSKNSGVPFTVDMRGGVIPGWLEGLKTMQVGGTRKLIIPQQLAYGWNPRPGSPIPPGATLIFDVEMLEIVDDSAPTGGGGGK